MVCDKKCQRLTVNIEYVKHSYVRVINREIASLLERQSEQAVRGVKHTVL